jgi:hypothetical protein
MLKSVLNKILKRQQPESEEQVEQASGPMNPVVQALIEEGLKTKSRYGSFDAEKFVKSDLMEEILALSNDQRASLVIDLIGKHEEERTDGRTRYEHRTLGVLETGINKLLMRKTLFSESETLVLLRWADFSKAHIYHTPLGHTIKAIVNSYTSSQSDAVLAGAIELHKTLSVLNVKEARTAAKRLADGLNLAPQLPVVPGEPWADGVIGDVTEFGEERRNGWNAILAHCSTASGGKPSKKWLADGRKLINGEDAISEQEFCEYLKRWMPLVEKPIMCCLI